MCILVGQFILTSDEIYRSSLRRAYVKRDSGCRMANLTAQEYKLVHMGAPPKVAKSELDSFLPESCFFLPERLGFFHEDNLFLA